MVAGSQCRCQEGEETCCQEACAQDQQGQAGESFQEVVNTCYNNV